MEVTITVAILALAAALVIPAMNNLSRAELRRASGQLAGTIRRAYDGAALSGQTYRLVFDLGKGAVRTEATEEALRFDDKSGAFVSAAQLAEEVAAPEHPADKGRGGRNKAKPEVEAGDDAVPASALSALLGINKVGQHAAHRGFEKKATFSLDKAIHLMDIWTDGMDQAAAEGDVYLYFFPSGYTQDALIHIEDEERRVFTVKVHALTGKTEILDGYVEVAK